MESIVLYGKPVADSIKKKLIKKVQKLKEQNVIPQLVVIIIGDDPASHIYVKNKAKAFLSLGCLSETIHFNADVTENKLIDTIEELNKKEKVHGVLVQFPLPKKLDSDKILKFISPDKDVDGFHSTNLGLLMRGTPRFIPCTPLGCIKILNHYNIQIEGKHVVIIGRSNIVGKPIANLFIQNQSYGNATVTICHSKTKNLRKYTTQADIIIAAVGFPHLITNNMIKKDAVVIDVGINRISDNSSKKGYKIVGDVDYDNIINKAYAVTPVPGGVGPMTITMLLYNTIEAASWINRN